MRHIHPDDREKCEGFLWTFAVCIAWLMLGIIFHFWLG